MTFYTRKNSPKILLAKLPPQKNLLLQNMLPKISSQENFFQKKIVPHFVPLIFILKNLLPKFFLPRICCQTFLLSIFLLTMKFYLQKILQNSFVAKFPPHTNLSSKTWSPKFPLKKSCFKKKLFPILHPPPPPPPQFFFHSKEFAPQIFPPKICCQTFLLSILLLTKNCFPNLLPKNLCCPNQWHLINTGAVAGYSAVPAALLLNFCHLLKNCDWTEKYLDLQYVQGIPLQQLPGS